MLSIRPEPTGSRLYTGGVELLDAGRVLLGIALLVGGGEVLVRGAVRLATRIGIPALVVGLVIVSFATSAPELAVTVGSVLDGEPALAVGNVVGSNIANVLLILGISALLLPLAVKRRLVRFDLPVMVGISVLFLVLVLDGEISQFDGAVLLLAAVGHIALSFAMGRRKTTSESTAPAESPSQPDSRGQGVVIPVVLLLAGLGLLVLGANLLVTGASAIAAGFGISPLVIGLTIVAIGTSLPELATSIAAVRQGERDLAVGNIVGSNILNIGVVLGIPAMIFPGGIPVPPAAVALDIPLMVAAAVALVPIAFTGYQIARWEGAVFVGLYAAFTAYVVLAAAEHDALEGFTDVMLFFVLPLIAVTLVGVTAYEFGLRRGLGSTQAQREPDRD